MAHTHARAQPLPNIISGLLQAALPSLTNPPSLSPIRRKGKEKESVESASVPQSPKKGSEASPGMGSIVCGLVLPAVRPTFILGWTKDTS